MKPSSYLSIAMLIGLSACGDAIDNDKLRVDVVSENVNSFNVNQSPLSLSSAELRASTAQGLVKFDKAGNIVPALASRWIVTDDGLSYIFRIEKTWWKNGQEVTAETVVASLRSIIRNMRRSDFIDEFESIEEIVAMTGRIIEIRLSAPRPNLLEILAQPEMGLIHNGFGSGPMQAQKQLQHMRLRQISFGEEGAISADDSWIVLSNKDAPAALARYTAGDADLIMGGSFADLPYVAAAGIDEELLQFDPVPGLFGFLFVEDSSFLSSAEVREAITMAIDRPRLLIDLRGDWREVLTLVPETLQNRSVVERPSWTNMRMDERINSAQQTISAWKSINGVARDLRIAMPVGPGADILFLRVKSDLARIGLTAVKVDIDADSDLRLIDRVAKLSSPKWYLSQLSCKKIIVCDAEADDLVNVARGTNSLTERSQLLAAAERRLQQKRNYIPIAFPTYWAIARPGLLGFSANPRGLHPLHYLGRDPT